MITKRKRKILSTVSSIAFAIGMIYIYSFRGGEYDWMLEMDPGIGNAPKSSDDWIFLSQTALTFTLATQVPMLFTRNRKYHGTLILIAVIVYWICNSH